MNGYVASMTSGERRTVNSATFNNVQCAVDRNRYVAGITGRAFYNVGVGSAGIVRD